MALDVRTGTPVISRTYEGTVPEGQARGPLAEGGLRGAQAQVADRDVLRLAEEHRGLRVLRRAGLLQGPGHGLPDAGGGPGAQLARGGLRAGEGQDGGRLPPRRAHGQGEPGQGPLDLHQPAQEAGGALREDRDAALGRAVPAAYLISDEHTIC